MRIVVVVFNPSALVSSLCAFYLIEFLFVYVCGAVFAAAIVRFDSFVSGFCVSNGGEICGSLGRSFLRFELDFLWFLCDVEFSLHFMRVSIYGVAVVFPAFFPFH